MVWQASVSPADMRPFDVGDSIRPGAIQAVVRVEDITTGMLRWRLPSRGHENVAGGPVDKGVGGRVSPDANIPRAPILLHRGRVKPGKVGSVVGQLALFDFGHPRGKLWCGRIYFDFNWLFHIVELIYQIFSVCQAFHWPCGFAGLRKMDTILSLFQQDQPYSRPSNKRIFLVCSSEA